MPRGGFGSDRLETMRIVGEGSCCRDAACLKESIVWFVFGLKRVIAHCL